jgi:hypothetical protein
MKIHRQGQVKMRRESMVKKIAIIALLSVPVALWADAHSAASCTLEDVQTAINAAIDNDTVTIPAGMCAWTGAVIWSNKNISVIGAGIGQTIITGKGARFYIHTETKAAFRISRITFSGSDHTGVPIQIKNNFNTPTSGFRIDHVRFHYTDDVGATIILITGLTYGVIDNCIFDLTAGLILQHYAYTENEGVYQGTTSWSLPLDLGGPSAIYFEDNDVNFSSTGNGYTGMNDSWTGGRLVFRYNDIMQAMFQTHGARGSFRGGLKLEIYNNAMRADNPKWDRLAQLRSGTGVFFNNSISGYDYPFLTMDCPRVCDSTVSAFGRCDGTSQWDGNTPGEAGWPCLDQPGRGPGPLGNQPSVPLYAWNNGPESGCHTGGPCTDQKVLVASWGYELCAPGPPYTASYIKTTGDTAPHAGGVLDFVNNGKTPMPGYTPYTYPHPLRTSGPLADDTGSAALVPMQRSSVPAACATIRLVGARVVVMLPAPVGVAELTIVNLAGRVVYHMPLSATQKTAGARYECAWRTPPAAGTYIAVVSDLTKAAATTRFVVVQ